MLSGTVDPLPNGTFKSTLEVQVGRPVGTLVEVETAEFAAEKEANDWIEAKGAWKVEA